jgi:hypothetical protein
MAFQSFSNGMGSSPVVTILKLSVGDMGPDSPDLVSRFDDVSDSGVGGLHWLMALTGIQELAQLEGRLAEN